MKTLVFVAYDLNNTFIVNELKVYGESGIPVRIYTHNDIPDELLQYKNLEIFLLKENTVKKRVLFFSYFLTMAGILFKEIKFHAMNIKYLFSIKESLLILLNQLDIALQIKNIEKDKNRGVFLSYWLFNEALALSFLSEINGIDSYYSRAHAFDIYEEDRPFGVIPFRNFQLKHAKNIFSVSQHGTSYLKTRYPNRSALFETSYLGTFNALNEIVFIPDEKISVVSCGSVQHRKRTNLILEVLQKVSEKVPVEWTHIGDGPQFGEFFGNVTGNSRFKINFTGNISNSEIFELYKTNSYTFFISLSDNEGIPVSIMEAISFGIPVISTNAGGCAEIVNEVTGLLIPVQFNSDDLVEKTISFANTKCQSFTERQKIRQFWNTNFNAEINYNKMMALFNL